MKDKISREDWLKFSHAHSERIQTILEGPIPKSEPMRLQLAISGYRLALEHHASIITLLDTDRTGSALALARPQLEAFLRGRWVEKIANPQEIELIAAGDDRCIPKLSVVRARLEEVDGSESWIQLVSNNRRFVSALHAATHGGSLQLNRVFLGDDQIGLPEGYWDEQLAALLYCANTLALEAALAITNATGDLSRTIALRAGFSVSPGSVIASQSCALSPPKTPSA